MTEKPNTPSNENAKSIPTDSSRSVAKKAISESAGANKKANSSHMSNTYKTYGSNKKKRKICDKSNNNLSREVID